VMTLKTLGCNHITCNCGTHWCYVCGEKSTEREIYAHLNTAHGAIFFAEDIGHEYDDDDEEEEE